MLRKKGKKMADNENKKSGGAGKFFLGAALGAIAGVVASKFISNSKDDECDCDECDCCDDEDEKVKSAKTAKPKAEVAKSELKSEASTKTAKKADKEK